MAEMGARLDYERGKVCIGRRVRIWMPTGRGNGKNGSPAMLKGATPKAAIVRFQGTSSDEYVPWDRVFDWVGGNGGVAPLPTVVPETTAAEHIELNRAFATNLNAVRAEDLREAIKEVDMQHGIEGLGDKIREKLASVTAAKASVKEANAVYQQELRELDALQAKAKSILETLEAQIKEVRS